MWVAIPEHHVCGIWQYTLISHTCTENTLPIELSSKPKFTSLCKKKNKNPHKSEISATTGKQNINFQLKYL